MAADWRGAIPDVSVTDTHHRPFGSSGGGPCTLEWVCAFPENGVYGWVNVDRLSSRVTFTLYLEDGTLECRIFTTKVNPSHLLFAVRKDGDGKEIPLILGESASCVCRDCRRGDTLMRLRSEFDGYFDGSSYYARINVPKGLFDLLQRVEDNMAGSVELPDGYFYKTIQAYTLITRAKI
jgi:hypothetical protein